MTYVLEILFKCGSRDSLQPEYESIIAGDSEENRQMIDVSWCIVRDI